MSRIVGKPKDLTDDSFSYRNFGQLLACRTLMGFFEAAFLPCAVFYCSLFYTRRELGFRTAIFFQMGMIAVRRTAKEQRFMY